MQIIIVQSEIEQAIRAHIEQQVSIKEGMEIEIDLRSTRGDAGFTANIDIVPAKNVGSQPKQTTAEVAKVQTTAVATKKESPELQKAEANQGKQEQPPVDNKHVQEGAEQFTQEQLAGSTDSDQNTGSGEKTNTEQAGEATGAEPSSTEQTGQAEQQAAEAPKGRSLFPNLKRISNG